jgi:NADH dehydrogenase
MGSLGSFKGFGTVLGLRIRGFIAWWLRRSYYLSLMPGWSRRIRIVMDWTLSLLFRPDIVKVDLTTRDSEQEASLERGSPRSAASGMVLKS